MHLSKKAGNTSVKNRLIVGIKMLLQDLWNIRIAILVFAIYFVIGRKFLYSLCPMVIMTGFPCPGCGLTRAMFMVLRGDFAGAWKMHPFIYGVIILVGWFGVRRYIQRNEESWEMGDSSVRRTDSILCVPNGKVFSGRCSDELLLWKRGIPGVGDN